MEQRLTATKGDDAGAEGGEAVDPPKHLHNRNSLGKAVVLVAIVTGEVATPNGNDVRRDRVARRLKSFGNDTSLANVK
jgi:hypothetical protein